MPRSIAPSGLVPRSKGARLLVVEDNPINQRVAAAMLEKLGYRVDLASDGNEAPETLGSGGPYEAVLMDVQMPEMDGYAATREIRRREASSSGTSEPTRPLPIIAMTANALEGDREAALEAGMDDYVPKPVKPAELNEVLERWVPAPADIGEETSAAVSSGAADASGNGHALREDPLDPEVLASLRELGSPGDGGEPDIISELVDLFFEDAEPRLSALEEAVESGDAEGVEKTAHTLKGSAGNMGARRMSAIASDLQDAGASGDLSGATVLLEELRSEYTRVKPALEELKNGG